MGLDADVGGAGGDVPLLADPGHAGGDDGGAQAWLAQRGVLIKGGVALEQLADGLAHRLR